MAFYGIRMRYTLVLVIVTARLRSTLYFLFSALLKDKRGRYYFLFFEVWGWIFFFAHSIKTQTKSASRQNANLRVEQIQPDSAPCGGHSRFV